MKCAYGLGFWSRFGMMLGMGKRCPLYKLKRLLIWLAVSALLPMTVWFVHPTEQEVEQAYREQIKAEANREAKELFAAMTSPHSEALREACSKPHAEWFNSFCTREQVK